MIFWYGSGSALLTYGSGSGIRKLIFHKCLTRWHQKLSFFSLNFFAHYCLKVHLHQFYIFIDKKTKKKSQNSRNQGSSSLLCLLMKGSLQNNDWSGRPKNIRILRIGIHNTDGRVRYWQLGLNIFQIFNEFNSVRWCLFLPRELPVLANSCTTPYAPYSYNLQI